MLSILDAEIGTLSANGLDRFVDVASNNAAWIGELTGLMAVLLIFGTPVFIVFAVLRHRSNRQLRINETVLKLAEKGQPIPPEIFMDKVKRKSDLRSAFSMIGAGLGLIGFFLIVGAEEGAGIGLIPLMIGIGQFVSWKIEQGNQPKP